MILVIAMAVSGCAASRAQIPEQEPTLVVPHVPPRAIEPPVLVEPPVEVPPVEPLPPPVAPSKPNRRPAADANKPDTTKPEPTPDPVATPPQPVAPLRAASTPSGPEATRQIRDMLDATQKMLDKVEPPLSDDRRATLRSARDFLQQAEEALKKEELTQARSFAERAQNMAKLLLAGR